MEGQTPSAMLQSLVGQRIAVKTKWGPVYKGTLVSLDSFMNLQLRDAVEESKNSVGELGEMLLRCNNILYLRKDVA